MSELPTVFNTSGLQPQPPASLLAQLLAKVAAVNPGYTASLPGSLIEDISSTDVAAMALIDQMRIELVNSLTPFGANPFILNQLGQVYGVPLGQASNTSVFVQFSGPPGFVIAKGFIVSDGNFQYALSDGGIIGSDGLSPQLFALATQSGTWAVPPGTVTQLVTSVPTPVTLTVNNPETGLPGNGTETYTSYRARVLQAGLAASQGMSRYLKTLLGQVAGVQPRLITAIQQDGGGWEVIVGGGDPYQVAYAIWQSLFDISTLVGSTLFVAGITHVSPAVVSTFLNHGFEIGNIIQIAGATPSGYNGTYTVIAVPTEKTFTLGVPYPAAQLTGLTWAATAGGQATATFAAPHGITVGSTFTVAGSAPVGYNGTFVAIAGTTGSTLIWALVSNPGLETTLGQLAAGVAFFDATALSSWVSGGIITPNTRNIAVTITDWPDTYTIPFVNPPQQPVTMTVLWNTTSPNFVAPAAVAQLGGPALVDYVNSVAVGQPMNLFSLESVFRDAISSVLSPEFLTRMVFEVSINGVGVSPDSGTGILEGDPESYFFSELSGINIEQG